MLISKINISFRVLGLSLLLDQCPIYPHWNGPTTTETPKKKKLFLSKTTAPHLHHALYVVCLFVCLFF